MRLGDIIWGILVVIIVFLAFYYWKGLTEVIRAGGSALTSTIATLQGQTLPGRSFPSNYPQ